MVVSELTVERRDGRREDAPLVLDGDGLALKRIEIDGAPLAGRLLRRRRISWSSPTPPPARRFRLTLETEIAPASKPGADGPLPVQRRLLHAMRGRRLPPHHLFPRPPGHSFGLHGAHRGRRKRSAAAALQRQSGRSRRSCRRPALCRLARSVPEALLSLRAGRRRPRRGQGRVRHRVRPQGRTRHLCRARQGAAARPTRWTR